MESIKLDGNVANVRKTYANTYQIFVHLDISWILLYFPYVFPGAIYFAIYIYIYIYIFDDRDFFIFFDYHDFFLTTEIFFELQCAR